MSDDWQKCKREFERLENAVNKVSMERDRFKKDLRIANEKIAELQLLIDRLRGGTGIA